MADTVTPLLAWRRGRDMTHTHEVVRETIPPNATAAIVRMACELDEARTRIDRLEAAIASLAREAMP